MTHKPEPTKEQRADDRQHGDDDTLFAQAACAGKTAEESFHWFLNPSS